jgi:hypothetical protein
MKSGASNGKLGGEGAHRGFPSDYQPSARWARSGKHCRACLFGSAHRDEGELGALPERTGSPVAIPHPPSAALSSKASPRLPVAGLSVWAGCPARLNGGGLNRPGGAICQAAGENIVLRAPASIRQAVAPDPYCLSEQILLKTRLAFLFNLSPRETDWLADNVSILSASNQRPSTLPR